MTTEADQYIPHRLEKGRVWEMLDTRGQQWTTVSDISDATGVPKRSVEQELAQMMVAGLVVKMEWRFMAWKHYRFWIVQDERPNVDESSAAPTANTRQVGGDHYRSQAIQPWDFIVSNSLGFLEGNVVKYVARHRTKGGLQDLEKARHYLDKLIEVETAKGTPT